MLYVHGIQIVPIKPFFKLQFPTVTLKQTTSITKYHEYVLLDYVLHVQSLEQLVQVCNEGKT